MSELLMTDLTSDPPRPDWVDQGSCRLSLISPDTWFPVDEDSPDAKTAKAICRSCLVQTQCLRESLRTATTMGIWGGMGDRERARLRRRIKEGSRRR